MRTTIFVIVLTLVAALVVGVNAAETDKGGECFCPCPCAEVPEPDPDDAPEEVTIDNVRAFAGPGAENLYGPVEFDHVTHVDVAESCYTCHHRAPPGKTPPCSGCHMKAFQAGKVGVPGFKGAMHRQCIDCHKAEGAPVGCEDCHALNKTGGKK